MNIKFHCPFTVNDLDKNYCRSCDKTLVDCRDKAEEEINDLIKKTSFCGVFSENQLSNSGSSLMKTAFRLAFAAVFFFGLNANHILAQEGSVKSNSVYEGRSNEVALVINGKAVDEKNIPIPFARVVVEIDSIFFFSKSDFNGIFNFNICCIDLPNDYLIHCKSVGYKEMIREIQTSDSSDVLLQLKLSPMSICGIITSPNEYQMSEDPYDFNKTVIKGEDLRW